MSGESKTSIRRIEAKKKAAEALFLRLAGATYQDIANQLAYKNPSGAQRAVERAMLDTIQEPADKLRKLELSRLDRMQRGLWGKAIIGGTGAVDRIIKIMERRAKLTGLDLPTIVKNELTGPNGGPILTDGDMDLSNLSFDELLQLKTLQEKARLGKGADASAPGS